MKTIISDQYKKLSGWARSVYEYVCLFNYYNINLNEELLVRASTKTFKPFREEVEKGELRKVIFPVETEWGNLDYRVHHPIIALRTVKMELNDPVHRVQKVKEVLKEINSASYHEVRKIERFLIFEIGPNSQEKEIPLNLKKEIFQLVSSQLSSRSIFHHFALLEIDGENKNFEKADSLLNKALRVRTPTNEKDEYIFTSFGKLFSQKGYQLEDSGKNEEAYRSYDLAERYFQRGRTKYYKNAKSYHGQIVLNRKRAEKSSNDIDKVKYYSKAIELCEVAISSLSETYHPEILEQQAKILSSLGYIEEFNKIIDTLAYEYNSSLGYKLKAILLYKNSFREQDEQQKTYMLEEAYEFVEKGLEIEDKDISLLGLKAKIGFELFPTDNDKLYSLLKNWYDFSDQMDLKLLFCYGIMAFKKEYYQDSKEIFEKLEAQSQGLPTRSSVFKIYIIKENEKHKKFYGTVESIDISGKKGLINCTSLDNLSYGLNFSPQKVRFTPSVGDNVVFNIAFNMRGIYAYDVRKD